MVDLNGHEAGNGGYRQGTPTARCAFLYSEPRALPEAVPHCITLNTASARPFSHELPVGPYCDHRFSRVGRWRVAGFE